MDFGNIIVLAFVITCIVGVVSFLLLNIKYLFMQKSSTLFVILNHLVLFCGIGIYAALYRWNIFWLWKSILAVLVFDIILTFMMLVRYYISEHYYDSLDIQDGILKKVYASQYLKILKLPKNCVTIEKEALSDLPELEIIYFGKNVEKVSADLLEAHPILHTLHFANPETKYDEEIKEKYTIKQK